MQNQLDMKCKACYTKKVKYALLIRRSQFEK
jgi:hypothetical protein